MARRSDHSREELTELALSAASAIAAADGLEGVTARRVAAAIGYAPGTLYNLFDNLDGLIVRVNGRTLDRLFEALSAVPAGGRPAQDLDRLLDAYLAFIQAHPELWSLLFEHRLPNGQDLPGWYHDKVARILELVEAALSPLFAPGEDSGKEEAARLIWAGLHGILTLAETGKLEVLSARPAADMARRLVAYIVAGLETRRTGKSAGSRLSAG